jgi:predicted nucleic acid-binding protein
VRFLVDADVLSEPTKPRPSVKVMEWWRRNDLQTAVNPIVLGEVEYGILCLPRGRRRERLKEWFEYGVKTRLVLEIDTQTAQVWATLLAELRRAGRHMPWKDSLIAATARQYDLTIATRNVSDFRFAGVHVENPFD